MVFTTSTEQSALCATVFGTLPSIRRLLVAEHQQIGAASAASRTSTAAGSPSSTRVSHSIPDRLRSSSLRSRIDLTRADELEAHWSSMS